MELQLDATITVLLISKITKTDVHVVPSNTLGNPAYHITGHCTICCKKSKSCAPEDGQKFARNMLS
jgi:hypothetical protein